MNKTSEQNTVNSGGKASFQSQNLGPNKVASAEAPPKAAPDVKSDPKPDSKSDVKHEDSQVIPEVVHQVTAKPVESKPLLQKHS